jgi:hypothetical protein
MAPLATNNTAPAAIAQLIKTAIEAPKPKARYAKGHMATIILWAKKWLSDAWFDRLIMSQLK